MIESRSCDPSANSAAATDGLTMKNTPPTSHVRKKYAFACGESRPTTITGSNQVGRMNPIVVRWWPTNEARHRPQLLHEPTRAQAVRPTQPRHENEHAEEHGDHSRQGPRREQPKGRGRPEEERKEHEREPREAEQRIAHDEATGGALGDEQVVERHRARPRRAADDEHPGQRGRAQIGEAVGEERERPHDQRTRTAPATVAVMSAALSVCAHASSLGDFGRRSTSPDPSPRLARIETTVTPEINAPTMPTWRVSKNRAAITQKT